MPVALGELLFVGASILLLLWAIYSMPLAEWQKNVILLICINELLTAGFNVQFNISIAAILLLTYLLALKEKEGWAPLPMLIGTFVKLYGIVGLAFFFFIKNKTKFVFAAIGWSVVLFVAPMILSSPEYVLNMYMEWFRALTVKNTQNVGLASHQDYSVMGFFCRTWGDATIPSLPFIIGGIVLSDCLICASHTIRIAHFNC